MSELGSDSAPLERLVDRFVGSAMVELPSDLALEGRFGVDIGTKYSPSSRSSTVRGTERKEPPSCDVESRDGRFFNWRFAQLFPGQPRRT